MAFVGLLNFAARVVIGARSRVSVLCGAVPHSARVDWTRHSDPVHITATNMLNIKEVVEMIQNHDWYKVTVHNTTKEIYTDASLENGKVTLGYSNGLASPNLREKT